MVEYKLGPQVYYDNIEDFLRIPEENLKETLTRSRMPQQRKRELIKTQEKSDNQGNGNSKVKIDEMLEDITDTSDIG
ncbi:hypothetical protein CHS0354_021856 [Potamilus streckersoni]|uniref:Uncharacterized protein n=1 Tax=Potamilus streckersoni TaxID=2493646 RepID=A0AAE0SF83_9BIVA|nr:hypothetical protein CHS0354_021856 [Potamilus streckersoni]